MMIAADDAEVEAEALDAGEIEVQGKIVAPMLQILERIIPPTAINNLINTYDI